MEMGVVSPEKNDTWLVLQEQCEEVQIRAECGMVEFRRSYITVPYKREPFSHLPFLDF